MKKLFLLAAVGLSLLTFLGYGVSPPGSSVAAAAFREAMPTPTPAPSLTIDKGWTLVNDLDDDGVTDPGDTIGYTITYENIGAGEATEVTIVDDYDQTLIASIINISGESEDNGDTITWNLGTVAAGASGSVTYDATLNTTFPTGPTDVINTATIKSVETAPASSTKTVTVEGPSLTIDKGVAAALVKDLDGDGVIDPGDTIEYIITYENTGGGDATNVTIVDDYDQTLIANIPSISGNGEDKADTIRWNIGTVAGGVRDSVTYEATLKSTFQVGSTGVANMAAIESVETGRMSDTETILVEVIPTPTPEPPKPDDGPLGGIFAGKPVGPTILIGILAIGAMIALVYVGAWAEYGSDDEDKQDKHELNLQRIALVREGVFLIFIVSAVLILAIARGIESDGAISILSAIAGYVFGRTRP